jgi:hypothetical protein
MPTAGNDKFVGMIGMRPPTACPIMPESADVAKLAATPSIGVGMLNCDPTFLSATPVAIPNKLEETGIPCVTLLNATDPTWLATVANTADDAGVFLAVTRGLLAMAIFNGIELVPLLIT